MKAKRIAFIIMTATIAFVTINTILLNLCITKFYGLLTKSDLHSPSGENAFYTAAEYYRSRVSFISLTVDHNDLTDIENDISEIYGYLSVGDTDGAQVAKSRLVGSVEHLRRLSGVNIDSII